MDGLTIGVDLGQASDPTAIAVAERLNSDQHVRHLERLPLGTPYPKVCDRINELCKALPGSRLVVDGTGVGRPVTDTLEADGLRPLVVFFTSGQRTRREGSRVWMPKAEILRPLIAGFDGGTVKIAAGLSLASALLKELRAFTVTRGEGGHVSYEGKGQHDDLVIAVALAMFEPVIPPRSNRKISLAVGNDY